MKNIWKFKLEGRALNGILLVILPVLTLIFLEFYTHVPWDLTVPIFF